jgi:hypothetical protein
MRRGTAAGVGQAVRVSASMTGRGSRGVPSAASGNGGAWPGGAAVHPQKWLTTWRRARRRRPWMSLRSWQGWSRHSTLALLAHAYLPVLRAQAGAPEPRPPPTTRRARESAKRLQR